MALAMMRKQVSLKNSSFYASPLPNLSALKRTRCPGFGAQLIKSEVIE